MVDLNINRGYEGQAGRIEENQGREDKEEKRMKCSLLLDFLTLKLKAVRSYETSGTIYLTT
jgi:hypothetical protein